jgi:hypothetical protein
MKQDRLQRAKERYADACEAMHEQHARIREDLRFSNPAKPEQWTDQARELRGNTRPMMTFNHCPKFIRQVVNDGRASVPSFQVTPADSFAHAKAAEIINGRIRHIEYVSKARVAYTTALGHAADCGLGWIRVEPQILNPETNQQEPRIMRVHDPLSCVLDVDSTEPDGCDAEWGFVLSPMSRAKFKRQWPKAMPSQGWTDEFRLWTYGDTVLVADYYEIVRKKTNKILIRTPDGETVSLTEDEYWEVAKAIGINPEVVSQFTMEDKTVIGSKMTGAEELEETEFPSSYIPLVPVIGDETWVDGKRYLCGLTRQLMDGQRMHNAEMSSYTESILAQPKAPFAVPMRAIEGHEAAWKKLNTGNPAFLPYNDTDEDGPVAAPTRLSPPQIPSAFANGAMMAIGEMEGSVGMYKASFGQQSNAVSGRAKQADRRESDTGTFHYHDNLARAVEQMGRIVVDMDRRLTDTARSVRTMSEDGTAGMVRYDPQMAGAVQMKGRTQEVQAINPRIGTYDLRVKVGPSFLTQNEETATELGEMFQGAPQLLPVLGPTWVRLKGIPGAEKIAKLLVSMAPPEVQKIEAEGDEETPIPPQAKAAIEQLETQVQELAQALEAAAAEAEKTGIEASKAKTESDKAEAEMLTRGYEAVTERIKVLAPGLAPEQIFALAQMTFGQGMAVPPVSDEPPITGIEPPQVPMDQSGPAMDAGEFAQPTQTLEPLETGELP